jgi:hypothetical protein
VSVKEEYRRRIFISPYQLRALDMLSDVVNIPPIIESLNIQKMDFQKIFFSTMFQCGVEELALICPYENQKNFKIESEFLSNRISFDSDLYHKYGLLLHKVRPLFEEYFENEDLQKADQENIFKTEVILTDLLFEMQTNLSSVSILPWSKPDLEKLRVTLEPEKYYPIRNLLSMIENDNLNLPLPTQSILSKDVKKFEKIIESNIFLKYAETHQELENKKIEKSSALSQITEKGKMLQTRFERHINLKEFGITTLNLAPSCVELIFGKIPGVIAENAIKLLDPIISRYVSDNQRLVTYEFSPISKEILTERLFNKSVIEHLKERNFQDITQFMNSK